MATFIKQKYHGNTLVPFASVFALVSFFRSLITLLCPLTCSHNPTTNCYNEKRHQASAATLCRVSSIFHADSLGTPIHPLALDDNCDQSR